MSKSFHIAISDAKQRVSDIPDEQRFSQLGHHESLTVELYKPIYTDLQQPHSRDGCYVVVEGNGFFEMADETVPFAPGDFIFVPAGMPHRFRDFGRSIICWVMFYGPEGGEKPDAGFD